MSNLELTEFEVEQLEKVGDILNSLPRLHSAVVLVQFQTENENEGTNTLSAHIKCTDCHKFLLINDILKYVSTDLVSRLTKTPNNKFRKS